MFKWWPLGKIIYGGRVTQVPAPKGPRPEIIRTGKVYTGRVAKYPEPKDPNQEIKRPTNQKDNEK